MALVAESDLACDFCNRELAANQEFLAHLQALCADKLHRTYARAESKQSRKVEARDAGQERKVTRSEWLGEMLRNV